MQETCIFINLRELSQRDAEVVYGEASESSR